MLAGRFMAKGKAQHQEEGECKNFGGKGLLKKGDKVVKCQRCKGRA